MSKIRSYTGGALDTNCFLLSTPGGNILFDAPQTADSYFAEDKVDLLVLTHGHFDHVADAAAIHKRHGCPVATHKDTLPMITDANFFRDWGFALEVEPVHCDHLLEEGATELLGEAMQVFLVPGHCPGSLCFYLPNHATLIGGDVLFAGGVGRWDLPAGDYELLVTGIRNKLLPLPPETTVLPGHGPATTIGQETTSNPFLRG